MIAKITCPICSIEMGTIEKPVITEADIALYQQMMQCPEGHTSAELHVAE